VRLTPWILAPVIVLFGVILTVWYRSEVPSRDDWRAATDHIRAHLRAGDGVTWAPYWAGEGRVFFDGLPAFHLTDELRPDLARYQRVWLLATFGSTAQEWAQVADVVSRVDFGEVSVELLRIKGPSVVSDLRASLDTAQVSLGVAPGKVCDFWDGRGWHCKRKWSEERTVQCLNESTAKRLNRFRRRRAPHCGLDKWLNVSRDVRVIGDMPRRCIWLHPRAGKVTRVQWDAPTGGSTLVVDYGFTDKVITDHTRAQTRTQPAKLTASQSGEVLGSVVITPEKGWRRWSAPLSRGGAGPVMIEVSTASTVDAHLCVDVTVRGERTP
jgi:hypothetical protein